MAFHARHVLALPGEVYVQIKFRRRDLLFRHGEPLRDPHAATKTRNARREGRDPEELILEVPSLPIRARRERYLVGPTLLDMLVRRRWTLQSLPPATQQALLDTLRNTDKKAPLAVMAWSIRDLETLWPRPGQRQSVPRDADAENIGERQLDHPFLGRFASGGAPMNHGSVGDWISVQKFSTCQVSEHVYRVAGGVFGGLDEAYARIADAAVSAWEADLERALQLWERVRAAPGEILVEDATVAKLRPLCSISREVERSVLREVCTWLGIDPEMSVTRPRGRPKAADKNAEQGEVVRVELRPDGSVKGCFVADYEGVASGTEFHLLALRQLVAILGALRTQGLQTDCTLLEAWLDAANPDWREQATGQSEDDTVGSSKPDPYDVLGVERSAAMGAITAAYRRAVQAVHPDKSGASTWLVRAVIEAYQQIRAERATQRDEPA